MWWLYLVLLLVLLVWKVLTLFIRHIAWSNCDLLNVVPCLDWALNRWLVFYSRLLVSLWETWVEVTWLLGLPRGEHFLSQTSPTLDSIMQVDAKRIQLYMPTVYKACNVAIRSLLRQFTSLNLLQMTEVWTHLKATVYSMVACLIIWCLPWLRFHILLNACACACILAGILIQMDLLHFLLCSTVADVYMLITVQYARVQLLGCSQRPLRDQIS